MSSSSTYDNDPRNIMITILRFNFYDAAADNNNNNDNDDDEDNDNYKAGCLRLSLVGFRIWLSIF